MNREPLVVVFAAIDGFIADGSQSSDRIIDAAARIADQDVPLVLCGSHTRAEIEHMQRDIGNTHPFISEHGAALFVPQCYFPAAGDRVEHPDGQDLFEFGLARSEVALTLHLVASRLGVEIMSFTDLSVAEIASRWNLSTERAELAKRRDYDEPFFLVHDRDIDRIQLRFGLQSSGLRWISGEGFDHVNGVRDPHASIERLRSLYERAYGSPVLTIGLAAALSDVNLLKGVDLPIIVQQTRHSTTADALRKRVPLAKVTPAVDADGWAQALGDIVCRVQNIRGCQRPPAW